LRGANPTDPTAIAVSNVVVVIELVGILFTGILGVHRLEGLAAKLMDTALQNIIKRVLNFFK
jgi:hypothetical protein